LEDEILKSTGKGLLLLCLLAALIVGVIWGLTHFLGLKASLIWTAVIGFATWAINKSSEDARERRRLLAERKRQQYLEFLDVLKRFIGGDDASSDTEILEKLRDWNLKLTLIASDSVIRAWNKARAISSVSPALPGPEVLHYWGTLILEMRKDSGHSDSTLKVSEVLGVFVNDIDQHRSALDTPRA
jgi:hypothetical protein